MASPPTYEEANSGHAGLAAEPSSWLPADLPPPPDYQEQRDDPGEILEPTIFVLKDRFIYSESMSAPRYQLSRVIHAQGQATNTIQFERVENRIRTLSDGTPTVTNRGRHIYDLHHFSSVFASEFGCEIEPVTRKGIGKAAIKKSPFPHSGYRVTKIPGEMEKKPDKNAYMYVIKEKKDVFEWADSNGKVIATEACRDGQPMLLVAVPLTRRKLDGLVALWCLWMWHVHIEKIKTPIGLNHWGDVKRIMQRPREQNTGLGGAWK
ncbi:hypothetical protein V8F20_010324 [Naviculisporaceae sp. PSN 640]